MPSLNKDKHMGSFPEGAFARKAQRRSFSIQDSYNWIFLLAGGRRIETTTN